MDVEFANDNAIYLHGHKANIFRFQLALERFCDVFGAKINWHKSCGFWVGEGEHPLWLPSAQFFVWHGHSISRLPHWPRVVDGAIDYTSPHEYQEEIDALEINSPLIGRERCGA